MVFRRGRVKRTTFLFIFHFLTFLVLFFFLFFLEGVGKLVTAFGTFECMHVEVSQESFTCSPSPKNGHGKEEWTRTYDGCLMEEQTALKIIRNLCTHYTV